MADRGRRGTQYLAELNMKCVGDFGISGSLEDLGFYLTRTKSKRGGPGEECFVTTVYEGLEPYRALGRKRFSDVTLWRLKPEGKLEYRTFLVNSYLSSSVKEEATRDYKM
jgi:hypothetical protein